MPEDVPITELTDITAERVDGVGSPANGTPFLMIKQLAAPACDEPAAEPVLTDEQAVAKALDEYGRWVKAKYTQDQIDALGKKGQAFKNPDGHYSYPVADKDDLSNAIKAVGRGGADHDAIRAYVIKRAKALGAADMIPENWAADGSLSKDAAAFLAMANTDTAGSDDTASSDAGDATVPGSPAWEQADADCLTQAGQALAQIACMIEQACNREQIEVATGHADDIADVYDLQDALCYVQNALGIVARVAFQEQAEAGDGMAKAVESLTGLQKTVNDLLGAAGSPQSATGADTQGGVLHMDITQEQLDEMLTKAAADAVAKAEADRKAAKADRKAAKVAKQTDTDTVEEEAGAAGDPAGEVTKETGSEAAAELGAVVAKAVEAAVAPLKEQVDQISKQAAPGGPLASASAARMGNPQLDLTQLQERFEKATDPVEKADLGERLTRMRFLARMTGQDMPAANPAA